MKKNTDRVFKVVWQSRDDGLSQENFLYACSKGEALRKFVQRKFSGVKMVIKVEYVCDKGTKK